MLTSLGIIETKGYATAASAADKILEDKKIEFKKVEKIGGGIITLFFEGEHDHLKTAFEKGIQQARLIGEIVAVNILKNPDENIEKMLVSKERASFSTTVDKNQIVKTQILDKASNGKKQNINIKKSIKKLPISVDEKSKSKTILFSSSSTIQRLRREALSSRKSEKDEALKSKGRKNKEFSQINLSKIENMNVHELRRLARGTSGFPIQGREISRANRKELVNYFKEIA